MHKKGFSLIELMIVVAIIGILAAVAVPGFVQYIKSSKTSEAKTNLKAIADGAISYFEAEHCYDAGCMSPTNQLYPGITKNSAYAVATQKLVPNAAKIGQKQSPQDSSVTTALAGDPWKSIKFQINKPFYYAYQYSSSGTEPGSQHLPPLQMQALTRQAIQHFSYQELRMEKSATSSIKVKLALTHRFSMQNSVKVVVVLVVSRSMTKS